MRSPVLDEILRSGQTLASDYAERMGMPSDSVTTDIVTKVTVTNDDSVTIGDSVTMAAPKRDRAAYMRDFRAKANS